MAEFNIPIEIPDNKVDEVISALRWRHGQVTDDHAEGEEPNDPRDRTVQELRDILKADCVENLTNCYRRHKKFLAAEAAATTIETDVPDIT